MFAIRCIPAALIIFLSVATAHGQFASTKIVETGVAYPGFGTLTSLVVRPSISGTTIAFGGNFASGPVLATTNAGTFSTLAGTTTPIPAGSGNFTTFNPSPIGLSGTVASFLGGSPGSNGVYSTVTGSLSPVVNTSTAFPTGGSFTSFSAAAVSGTKFIFSGTNNFGPFPIGVFTRDGTNAIVTLANTSTPMPGGTGNFFQFNDNTNGVFLPNISGNNVVFGGQTNTGRVGLFASIAGGPLSVVATNSTAVPSSTGTFTTFGTVPAISGTTIAFYATSASTAGVYRSINGSLERVADRTTPIPGGIGNFNSFLMTDLALANDRVAFRGTSVTNVSGIYSDLSGSLQKVIATGDSFDGKTVNAVNIGQFSLDGTTLAVMVGFTNGTAGVYTFTPIPEPRAMLFIVVLGVLRLRKS